MAVSIMKAVSSAAIGGLDIGLEMWDEQDGRTEPFKRATDFGRIGAVAGGLALDFFMPRMGVGEAMFYSGIPLLEKSIKDVVMAVPPPAVGGLRGRGLRLQALTSGAGAGSDAATYESKRGQL